LPLPSISLVSLEKVYIDVIFCFGKLVYSEGLIGAREEVYLWAEDVGKKRFKKLEKNVLKHDLGQWSFFKDDEALAVVGGKCSEF